MSKQHAIREPSPWVERFAGLVPTGGAVLDLACGAGRHGRLFLGRGHPVTFVDVDVAGVQDLAGQNLAEIVAADLEGDAPWPLGERRFSAVVVTNYLWRPLLGRLLRSLEADGVVIYETFALGNECHGRPSNPDFLARDGELLRWVFGRLHVVAYEHGLVRQPRVAVVQRLCAVGRSADESPAYALS